ncbi:MAG: ABC transporter ATP-binding protein [Bryobacteraceae bacterium]|jgi:ABC-type dipeptide/oligopeptide/nickel transport system ATPase component
MSVLLETRLSVDYPNKPGVLREVRLKVSEGEMLGLVGESGSGKSTIALALLRLLEHKGGAIHGEILFNGRDLLQLRPREMRQIRGREIALVLQSPLASLNPALRIGTQVAEAWRAHVSGAAAKQWKDQALELFDRVSLPAEESFLSRYPRQLSVGQAQRVLIAMAVLHKPRLLIADEPTSALDAVTQSEILDLFRRLNREMNMAMLFISHDLLAVASLCSRIAILQRGQIIESGPTAQMFRDPHTADTRTLLEAVLRNSAAAAEFARTLEPDRTTSPR